MDEGSHIEWYYAEGGQPKGPVDEAVLQALAGSGTITAETLVWNPQLPSWVPYARTGALGESFIVHQPTVRCVECGVDALLDESIAVGNAFVCASCKSVFLQRLEQGLAVPATMHYASFGLRVFAKFIDATLIYSFQYPLMLLIRLASDSSESTLTPLLWGLSSFSGICFGVAYGTYMVGRYGATVGKMAMGLRVVRPDGQPVTYARAAGRVFAEYISAILMNIGYIIAAFDDERRALHDRICETRVIVD